LDNYNIYSLEKLNSLMDENGYINDDIAIRGNEIMSLGKLKKVYGTIGIDSNSLSDLGELNYVKNDFWITSAHSLKSLGNLEKVEGSISLRYSDITDLGKLSTVNNKLSLRDTKVKNIKSLKKVKTLFLPKSLKGVDVDFIDVQTVKYWSDKLDRIDKEKERLIDVGGQHLRHYITIDNDTNREIGSGEWDSKIGFRIRLTRFSTSNNPMEKYFISKDTLRFQEENFRFYQEKLVKDVEYLNQFRDDYEIEKLRNRLVHDLLESMVKKKIDLEHFIEKTKFYEDLFSNFTFTTKMEFLPIYELLNKNDLLNDLLKSNKIESNYSKIHDLELRLKKRVLSGEFIVQKVTGFNGYIQDNIDEFSKYIDQKLEELYSGNYSFFNALFGKTKTITQINDEFPKRFKVPSYTHGFNYYMTRREKSLLYINSHQNESPFIEYVRVLEKYNDHEFTQMATNHLTNVKRWLSYNEIPLNYYQQDPKCFISYIENLIYHVFNGFVLGLQNDFRISKGIPKISEGWVSETDLFYRLKDYFEKEDIKQHAKPKWLGRQHVDVWFPKHKIGIEYQGMQHYMPVDFFGGEEAFLKNKERDERKRKLFKENKSKLIEVRKGYSFESLVKEINNYISK
jgi:hypothetical protein